MRLFSTILPIKNSISAADLDNIINDWELRGNFIKKVTYESETANIYHYFGGKNIPWIQTFVYDKSQNHIYVSQETDDKRYSVRELERNYSTPSFITDLIDHDILQEGIHKKPVQVLCDGLPLPKLFINDKSNARRLAFRLKGAAQVCYKPMPRNIFSSSFGVEEIESIDEIVHKVLEYGRTYFTEPGYAPSVTKSLSESTSRCADLEMKLQDANDLIAAYDEEIKDLENSNVAANNQLSANSVYIQGLERHLTDVTKPTLLTYGEENDLYDGESRDLILEILQREFSAAPENTRRKDILQSVLDSNEPIGVRESIKEKLRKSLRDYTTMAPSKRLMLESLGFEIGDSGAHYKLIFKGDPRYILVLSKTSSDHREGKNFISHTNKMLF